MSSRARFISRPFIYSVFVTHTAEESLGILSMSTLLETIKQNRDFKTELTHNWSFGESGRGSNVLSCFRMGVVVRGGEIEGRQGDSRRAWPIPESSESWLISAYIS